MGFCVSLLSCYRLLDLKCRNTLLPVQKMSNSINWKKKKNPENTYPVEGNKLLRRSSTATLSHDILYSLQHSLLTFFALPMPTSTQHSPVGSEFSWGVGIPAASHHEGPQGAERLSQQICNLRVKLQTIVPFFQLEVYFLLTCTWKYIDCVLGRATVKTFLHAQQHCDWIDPV